MTRTTLDRMPGMELMGDRLDLSRPELAQLMARYTSRKHILPRATVDPPTALIVTRYAGEEWPLRMALEEQTWSVKTCRGPARAACPVLSGERCPLRSSVDAAVVFVEPSEGSGCSASIPRLRCAVDSASPGVIALEGSFERPRYIRGVATIGALRSPQTILKTIAELLDDE